MGVMETLDRVSKLPDSLLVQILSLLPTQEAFTTFILSKTWRYVWPYVDNFNFSHKNYLKTKEFVPFVDYVLA